jgi:ankyrin repeat protein
LFDIIEGDHNVLKEAARSLLTVFGNRDHQPRFVTQCKQCLTRIRDETAVDWSLLNIINCTDNSDKILIEAIDAIFLMFSQLGAQYPDLLAKACYELRNPLHYACKFSASPSTIQALAKVAPAYVLDTPDDQGMTPLCYALERKNLPPNVILCLAEKFPNGVIARKGGVMTVLHDACFFAVSSESIQALASRFPQTLQLRTESRAQDDEELFDNDDVSPQLRRTDGDTPLHSACRSPYSAVAAIEVLLTAYPPAAVMRNRHGDYPLHLVRNPAIVSLLLQSAPLVIRKLNNLGQAPLHAICDKHWHRIHCYPHQVLMQAFGLLVKNFPVACIITDEECKCPLDRLCSMPWGDDDAPLDEGLMSYLNVSTKDAVCAMVECILHPKSTAPRAVIEHVQAAIEKAFPGMRDQVRTAGNQLSLAEALRRVRLDWWLLKTHLRNTDLQTLFKQDEHFQNLICNVVCMNQVNRKYFQEDPLDKLTGMIVLKTLSFPDRVDGLFLHLRENPSLCDRYRGPRSRKRKAPS